MTSTRNAQLGLGLDSGAIFSPDRRYRYKLWRAWGDRSKKCVFIGVNPSTADESNPDQTITKEVGFSKRWGYGALFKVNLFGLVSTDVRGLLAAIDPIGPENDEHILQVIKDASRVVFAWGKHPAGVRKLVRARLDGPIGRALSDLPNAGTLGYNEDGSPRHPLMLSYETQFEPRWPDALL